MNDLCAHAHAPTKPQRKSPCKSVKRDGSPCHGHGLDQFDGYCFAHAPAHITSVWRARGGRNSSTAARLDKRIPQHLKDLLTQLTQGLSDVHAGELEPAAYNAMCRGVATILDVHRQVEKEMDLIRAEEAQTAAQEVAGVHGDLEILTAAAAIVERENEYRARGLADQGLATLRKSSDPDKPLAAVLTREGKRRFGERRITGYLQEDIDEIRNAVRNFEYDESELPDVLEDLSSMTESFDETLAGLAQQPDLPRDPFTGQPLSEPPPGVQRDELSGLPPLHDDRTPLHDDRTAEILTDQRNQLQALYREVEELKRDEHYSTKRDLYKQGEDLDTVTITKNRPPPTIDHALLPAARN